MKKALYLLFLLPLFSCNMDDNPSKENDNEFLDKVTGLYKVKAVYTDTPLDLNNDGETHTDLYEEVWYCYTSLNLESYTCRFDEQPQDFGVYIPYSRYILEIESYESCLQQQFVFCNYEINPETEEVNLVRSEYYDDFAAQYNTEFVDLTWENEVVLFTFKKEFYTSSNEWQEVTLYMEFEKVLNDI